MALSALFLARMRPATDSITSPHENCRRAMPSASSHALFCQSSSAMVSLLALPRDLERHVLVRGRVREALDVVDAGLPDARADAPEEGELVDGHVHHPVVHDLLDLVEHGLALFPVQLSRLALVQLLDLGH